MRCMSLAACGLGAILSLTACQQREQPERGAGPRVEVDRNPVMPGWVVAGFEREFPDATIQEVVKHSHADGTDHWEVQYVGKDGQTGKAMFDKDGKLVP